MIGRFASCLLAAPLTIVASACATTDSGWTGAGAVPFDIALADCHREVDVIPEQVEREAALETCMNGKGWQRG